MLEPVLIAYGQMIPLNDHVYISSGSGTKGLTFSLGLHLQSYFVHASIEGSGESAHLLKQHVKYQSCVCWLKYVLAFTEMHHLDTK